MSPPVLTKIEDKSTKNLSTDKNSWRGKRERKHVPGLVVPFLYRELECTLKSGPARVWMNLYLHTNRHGSCFMLNRTLRRKTGLSLHAIQDAKNNLIAQGWLETDGREGGRDANVYYPKIRLPPLLEKFYSDFTDKMMAETWWEREGIDGHDYTDNHLDWLIQWRVLRVLFDSDESKTWSPKKPIPEELGTKAMNALLDKLRVAAKGLNEERGIWWLFGDALDAMSDHAPKVLRVGEQK